VAVEWPRVGPPRAFARCSMTLILGLLTWCSGGCAGPVRSGNFKLVQFEAPSYPDTKLRAILDSVSTFGVVSVTDMELVTGLDTEKVIGRLTDATAIGLKRVPDRRVITHDEIRWHFKNVVFDSTTLSSHETRAALREEMDIDAIVLVTLRGLDAQVTSVMPTQYERTPTEQLNISVDLKLSVINLATGETWSHVGRQRDWRPLRGQPVGGADRKEQELLTSLGQPLRDFLARVAPQATLERRHFDLSGD
jgi:hypothetical protein